LCAGIEAGAVTHTKLFDIFYGCGYKLDFFAYTVKKSCALFNLVDVGGVQYNAVDAFFEDFGH